MCMVLSCPQKVSIPSETNGYRDENEKRTH